MAERCMGRSRHGGSCSAQARPSRQWCTWHDPDLEGDRATWRRKGGEGRSTAKRAGKRLPKTLLNVQEALLRAMTAVEVGELEPARANAMGNLARALVTITEYATVEDRFVELERAVAEAQRAPWVRGRGQ
ncbi:MAG: hypothetical protein M3R02_30845 [Chloroflexota bacterium]|nr:hypothetical protein [Chloroflexota bacterium]